jgi:predicted MFS family arabinose efflux permease
MNTAFYIIGMWYKREEALKRYAIFFQSTSLAGAFGGAIAAGVGNLDGRHGMAAWRWLFIIEGTAAMFFSFFFVFLLPDFPEDSKWLTEEEKTFVLARLEADQGMSAAHHRKITLRDVGLVLSDFKVIAAGFMYFGLIVTAYGYAYFSPGIIESYGFSPIQTQWHSIPPWVAAFGFSMTIAFLSDKFKHRFYFAIFCMIIAMIGLSILIAVHDKTHLEYGALFLVAMGTYSAMPTVICWFNMNLGGHHRRSIGSAWQIGFGNVAAIISVFAFLTKDAPTFTTGYSICLSFVILSMIASAIYWIGCSAANKKRDTEAENERGLSVEEKTELGDMSPAYRYML